MVLSNNRVECEQWSNRDTQVKADLLESENTHTRSGELNTCSAFPAFELHYGGRIWELSSITNETLAGPNPLEGEGTICGNVYIHSLNAHLFIKRRHIPQRMCPPHGSHATARVISSNVGGRKKALRMLEMASAWEKRPSHKRGRARWHDKWCYAVRQWEEGRKYAYTKFHRQPDKWIIE